jgi:hypothetical protein
MIHIHLLYPRLRIIINFKEGCHPEQSLLGGSLATVFCPIANPQILVILMRLATPARALGTVCYRNLQVSAVLLNCWTSPYTSPSRIEC